MANPISEEILKTHEHLHALHDQIQSGVQIFDAAGLQNIVDDLHKDCNFLMRHSHKMEELKEAVVPIDTKIKKDILDLIFKILHSPDFSHALGPIQRELVPVLKKVKLAIEKWQSKVEKVM